MIGSRRTDEQSFRSERREPHSDLGESVWNNQHERRYGFGHHDLRNSATAVKPWKRTSKSGHPKTIFVLQFGHKLNRCGIQPLDRIA